MKPVHFPGVNVIYAEEQPEYLPLPVIKFPNGETIQCWELTNDELKVIQETKCVWVSQLTFNEPLQPIALTFTPDVLYPHRYEPCTFDSLQTGDVVLLFNKLAPENQKFDEREIDSKTDEEIFILNVPFGLDLKCTLLDDVMIMAKVKA